MKEKEEPVHFIDEEAEEWAEKERKRRKAWLSGPSEVEKRDWARRQYNLRVESRTASGPVVDVTDDEVEEWAEKERKRRQAWLSGPSEVEKRDWARRHYHREKVYCDTPIEEDPNYEVASERASRLRREGELATKGFISWLLEYPYYTWSSMVEAGRETEERSYRPVRRRRIKYYD